MNDALLDFLSATLPPPLYSFTLTVLSHIHTAATALISLTASLIVENPSDWRAEAILPPIITILAAYLALASLYRTASWAIRLSLFFLKWGTLIGVAMAIAGYLAGKGKDIVANQNSEAVVNVFSGMFNGGTSSKYKRQSNPRQKERSKLWQYQEQPKVPETNPSAQQLMDSIVRVAEGALGGTWWGAAVNSQRDGFTSPTKETQDRRKNGKTRSR